MTIWCRLEKLIDLKLELPAGLAEGALKAAYWKGVESGAFATALCCLALAVIVLALMGRRQ